MTGLKSILKPILTEKATSLQDDGVYVFQVTSKTDKNFH
jgi:ribosomal protein L23